jgi:hypothetical protein
VDGSTPDIKRVLRYILRSALPLKRLTYVERSGQVHYQDPHGPGKTWPHAVDFLADFVQHIPRARQHQVTYAGYFANALGNLSPKKVEGEPAEPKKPTRATRWAALILRTWAVDPEQCPKCNKPMRRSRALMWALGVHRGRFDDPDEVEAMGSGLLQASDTSHPSRGDQLPRIHTSTLVAPWPTRRVTLLGDAIHSMTPYQGIDANIALKTPSC